MLYNCKNFGVFSEIFPYLPTSVHRVYGYCKNFGVFPEIFPYFLVQCAPDFREITCCPWYIIYFLSFGEFRQQCHIYVYMYMIYPLPYIFIIAWTTTWQKRNNAYLLCSEDGIKTKGVLASPPWPTCSNALTRPLRTLSDQRLNWGFDSFDWNPSDKYWATLFQHVQINNSLFVHIIVFSALI